MKIFTNDRSFSNMNIRYRVRVFYLVIFKLLVRTKYIGLLIDPNHSIHGRREYVGGCVCRSVLA